MTIGAIVTHCMGHVGTVVAISGPIAEVQFTNSRSWVWISDLVIGLVAVGR